MEAELRALYEKHGQGHVFDLLPLLEAPEKAEKKTAFLQQLKEIDVEDLDRIRTAAVEYDNSVKKGPQGQTLEPLPVERAREMPADERRRLVGLGEAEVKAGRVAVLVLAGGQGTRLGYSKPKGMYDIGMPSHKSLFQVQAERLRKLQDLVGGCTVPWYIMTSPATHKDTVAYFEEHKFFGLDAKNVFFFSQGTLPCLTPEGKIILESAETVASAPDGNGGIYMALQKSGALDDMKKRGIVHVHQYCVDNILVKMADPLFIGYCADKNAECACKVVAKASPTEAVGVVCKRNGLYSVVEYSEIDKETAEKVDENGTLVYNAAHLCINYFSVPFLEAAATTFKNKLWHHIARKKIPYADKEGNTIKPDAVNGWKLEQFIFDMFGNAKTLVCLEIERKEEFSPLKNPEGTPTDSPDSSRALLSNLHRSYIVQAGGTVEGDGLCEVSPLLSLEGEGLESVCKGKVFKTPVLLE